MWNLSGQENHAVCAIRGKIVSDNLDDHLDAYKFYNTVDFNQSLLVPVRDVG